MKHFLIVLALVLCIFLVFTGCDFQQGVQGTEDQLINSKVVEQLQAANENMAEQGLPARIVSYNFESTINNDEQLLALQNELLAANNVVPQFDGIDNTSWSLNTIEERMSRYRSNMENEQNIVANIQQFAFPAIKKGDKVLSILWEENGERFTSKCVFNDEGIVYDNMLSNIVIIDAETVEDKPAQDEMLTSLAATGDALTRAQQSFERTVRDYTIQWVWGGTRGKIIIKHYIIWNGIDYINTHGGSTNAWMSLGSAEAKWNNNALSRYSYSKMAWAFGWATPTASFSISWNSSKLTFSASTSGVGSKGCGSGVHTIYLP